jgi:hypothetical protein
MNKRISFAAVLIILIVGSVVRGEGAAIPLAENGQARAAIVVAADASAPEKHAAAELSAILQQVTGAAFEIQNQKPASGAAVLIGKSAAKLVDPAFSTADLGLEGIAVVTRNGRLILTGDTPRGTLYAVYSFLEDVVGCRWWSSKASTIPAKPTLAIEPLNIRYSPPFEYRESFWYDAFDGDWAVRNKCNGFSHRLDADRAGRHQYYGFVHTFYGLIPPDKYFDAHPEWFSEIDGKRVREKAQLCLTNSAMREELTKNLKQALKENPEATIASVSQNDFIGNCQCAACKAIDAEEGSPSGLLLRFVNAVADEVAKDFPNVAIDTLAYQYTRKPPKITRPNEHVIVRLCSIECSFSVPLDHNRNADFRDDMQGWSKICNRLYVWDYTTNFNHYFRPHPNLRVLGPNIRFFEKNHVKGVFEQGAYNTHCSDMAELRAWVLAKLLWNPNFDDQKLIQEFAQGYYGPAAPHVEAYINLIHDSVDKSGYFLGCLPGEPEPEPGFLPFEVLAEGWRELSAAEKAVAGNPELLDRVRIAQLPVLYAFVRNWNHCRDRANQLKADWPIDPTPQPAYERFRQLERQERISGLCEWDRTLTLLDKALEQIPK